MKTKEILALEEIKDEKAHDDKILKNLVDHVLDSSSSSESNTVKLKLILTGGAYDFNTNFRYVENKKLNRGEK